MKKLREEKDYRSEKPFCGGRWVDRRLWRNPLEKLKGLSLRRQAGRWDCLNEVSCPSACLAFRWSLSPFMFSRIPERRRGHPFCRRRIRFSDTGFFLFPKVYLSSPASSESLRQTQIYSHSRIRFLSGSTIAGETDSSSSPIFRNSSVSSRSAPSSPQIPIHAPSA